MRLIAFLFLAAFALAGAARYSRADAPGQGGRNQLLRPLAIAGVGAALSQSSSLAALQPAPQPPPQVLRHKRRFAKSALRAIAKPSPPDTLKPKVKPAVRMAKVVKQARR